MEYAIFEIPYVYKATVIPPRKRNPVELPVRSSVSVKLPIYTSSDIPVAIKVTNSIHGQEDESYDLRWNGLELFREYNQHSRSLSVVELQAKFNNLKDAPLPHAQWHAWSQHHHTNVEVKTEAELNNEGYRWIKHNSDLGKAGLLNTIKALAIIDGCFWFPCNEPIWVINESFSSSWVEIGGIEDYELEAAIASAGVRPLFSANQKQEAIDSCKPSYRGEKFVSGDIEVLIPDALRLPTRHINIGAAVKQILSIVKSDLHEMPVEGMIAYANARDAFATWNGRTELTESMMIAAENLRDNIELLRPPELHGYRRPIFGEEQLSASLDSFKKTFNDEDRNSSEMMHK